MRSFRTVNNFLLVLACTTSVASEPPLKGPTEKVVALPGMKIDLENRCVDVEGTICVNDGLLELIACTKGSKEHESIIAVAARPMHIHTGLLAIGVNNGHPSLRKQSGSGDGWIRVPATGDPVKISLVTKSLDGREVERPVSDLVISSSERIDEVDGEIRVSPGQLDRDSNTQHRRLPEAFVFSGSQFRITEGPVKNYSADLSGNLISIATFGDEVLSLPFYQTQDNKGLSWRANPDLLPKRGTSVILRLRPGKTQTASLKDRAAKKNTPPKDSGDVK